MHAYRSHNCSQLRSANVGEEVRLSGWIHNIRDHGNLMFVDLRDHFGLTQIVSEEGSEAFKMLDAARKESVITVTGKVAARSTDTINANLPTGEVELVADAVEMQGPAEELPMPVFGEQEYPEDVRLRYRFLG